MTQTQRFIAVDLGGTQIRAARYTADGVQETRVAMPTQASKGLETVLGRIVKAIQQVWAFEGDGRIEAIALGAPGPTDAKQGIVRFTPNISGWHNVPLRDRLLESFSVPVFVGNDADYAALAEHRFGAGQGVTDMIYMTISTGVGGGFIFNNRLYTGAGLGGEVGHMVVDVNGPRCSCGNSGCLEVMASGTAIARQVKERLMAGEPSLLLEMVKGDIERITAKEVNEAGQQGDALAQEAFATSGMYIGTAIVSLMYMLNPELFVLGGSVTKAGDLLFAPIRETVKQRAPEVYRKSTRIVPAVLGDDVGLRGAFALCLMEFGL
ncbi:MAG: ROK family protein [Anaerolineae bacterium]|nr:ROK family protein [Anaerolineae bacterium]